ncbi:hypothetical protein LSAT2_013258, partial [Lamellibrachia satsuma]
NDVRRAKTVTIGVFLIYSSLQNDFGLHELSVVVACLPYIGEDGVGEERNFVGPEPSVVSRCVGGAGKERDFAGPESSVVSRCGGRSWEGEELRRT